MDFTNSYRGSNEYCEECRTHKNFCRCQTPNSGGGENCIHQDISDHHPCQTIGEQEQQQQQEQGGLEQTQGSQKQGPQLQEQTQEGQKQGPQNQDQIQEGQSQGPQIQEQTQGPQTQGSPVQGPQTQNQTEDQDQTQGPQIQLQRHGDQTNGDQILENNQSISTSVDVDGVTVNVKCGDCMPVIFPVDFFKKHKHRNHCDCGCEDTDNFDCGCDDMDSCNCRRHKEERCITDNNCCVQNLSELLNRVREFQSTPGLSDADRQIDIYFNGITPLDNPTLDQVITGVDNCILKFKPVAQTTVVPYTTAQLCDIAGICATDNPGSTTDVFQFLLDLANADSEDRNCKKKRKKCCCPCCAAGIGEELKCTANFGLLLDINIKGLTIPLPLYVLKVKDCLAYFVDNLVTPTEVCVFSLCAISSFTVVSQTLGTP